MVSTRSDPRPLGGPHGGLGSQGPQPRGDLSGLQPRRYTAALWRKRSGRSASPRFRVWDLNPQAQPCLLHNTMSASLIVGRLFQALLLWDTASSPPALSKSLLHAHKDWITGCAWAAGRAVGPPWKNSTCERSFVLRVASVLNLKGVVFGSWGGRCNFGAPLF